MISFFSAREKILAYANKLPAREIFLNEAVGCVLAADIYAPIDLPPFNNAAMDGVALNSEEASGNIEISQIIKAGDAAKPLIKSTCAKIMTGAEIPEGADTVIPVEDLIIKDNVVILSKPFKIGGHVRYKGEDVKEGTLALPVGAVVNSRTIAILAALGFEKVPVPQRPRVGVITTGSELQMPGTRLLQGKIFDSNEATLSAALKEIGISADLLHIADDREKISCAVKESLEHYDILITVGGVSVGEYDYVKEAFERAGVRELFHKVAIKPGKPIYFGIARGSRLIFGLPGNPVSALITFQQFVRPAIYKMMGRDYCPQVTKATAGEKLKGSSGKRDFLRGICDESGGVLRVRSAGFQGSAMLKSLVTANCTIIIPEDKEIIEKGEPVEVEPW